MATSLIEGAKELLGETISALNEVCIRDYIVIGGWCPYLRNTTGLLHPGTLDVDVLFKDGGRRGALNDAIRALKDHGFAVSAKHSFQLLLEREVRGERLIYNVDLLHPQMSETESGMFVDHLDLDVPLDEEERRVKQMTSIVLPNSAVLFDESLFTAYRLKGFEFNLVDFTGMLLTKMDSCQKQKRDRDALDLYIALKSGKIDFSSVARLRLANARIAKSLNQLSDYLGQHGQTFDENLKRSAQNFPNLSESPAAALRAAIDATKPND